MLHRSTCIHRRNCPLDFLGIDAGDGPGSARARIPAPFLSALCDSSAGLTFGCTVLAAKLAAAGSNVLRGLAVWNGGGNPDYASQVLARVPRYR
jgi:hypothetical protein